MSAPTSTMGGVAMIAVVADGSGGGLLRSLDAAGEPTGPVEAVADLAAAVEARERDGGPRWLWGSTEQVYGPLLPAGVRVRRCHDVELAEVLLLGYAGRYGEPRSAAAAYARLTGAPVPADHAARPAQPPGDLQGTLFGDTPAPVAVPDGVDPLEALAAVYRDQLARTAAVEHPTRMRLLIAAESASALIAAEMGHTGLPWQARAHDEILVGLLGEQSPVGGPPRRLAELSGRIAELLNAPGLHPDSPAELRKALRRAGIEVPNTRSWVLRAVDHPVIEVLLEYKELYRIWTAHGWSWREQWVQQGRFRPAYVPGGVVTGRWATRGGGALQIPKAVRGAARADPGWRLVVADAGQLEPRILAAVSGDAGLARAAAAGDLYAVLAAEAFKGDRAAAKLALLGAMYGQTGGAAAPAIAALRGSYPKAWAYVEAAARTGETGGLVRSWLGRTCPPSALESSWTDEGASGRSRGRFTRNFVIQATAAEWAASLLATLRARLWDTRAELVFFQHDEVIVHCPDDEADVVVAALETGAKATGELLFGSSPVRFPLTVAVVDSYGDAK
ncbi:DNA polymerase I [Catellatospora citrea]|uniref:DNA-directed DNA polymerase n=2 Tax=Catellatospora citrea TaxID=53366 RepID=A0A8J3K1M3_9ACTN|nr:bifunctional 3'-5' exonuclease/DNA polymerase [Catellatospora citrea]RKE06865.1 DNA polymerase-1 [Catellatospora citrea]GIF95012.1 DNA polymerase I [Catellatospora citrea]